MSESAPTELETIAWLDHAGDLIRKQMTEIERLREKVRNLTKLLDDQLGTPCEQIRHEQEIERLRAALDEISDLAVALCAYCRQNIGDKQFINWCHDEIGVRIINICNSLEHGEKG